MDKLIHASQQPEWDEEQEQEPVYASKRPLSASQFIDREAGEDEEEDSGEDSDGQPDLDDYFSQWDISAKEQILMCRAYASYLSAKRAPFKKQKK